MSMSHPTPVVLLHAFPLGPAMWHAQVEALAGRTVLTPSFPGFGGRAPGGDSVDAFADAVLTNMDDAGIDRGVIVGLSLGGYIAFRIHARAPERVAALVLADTRATPDDEAGRAKRTEQAEQARKEGVAWLPDALVPAVLGDTTRRERPEVERTVRGMVAAADPEGVARALIAIRDRPDSSGALSGIRVPVLALVGEEDGITPPAAAREIAEGVPDGRLVVVPGAGHLSNLEDPAAFNEALLAFLAEAGL